LKLAVFFPRSLRPIWAYRGFISGSVKREFQSKHRNSLLGAAWTVINPLAMIVVYTVIFSRLMHSRLPGVSGTFAYSIYLCAGVLTWGLFAEITGRAQNTFIGNAGQHSSKAQTRRSCQAGGVGEPMLLGIVQNWTNS
jgi:ABC-type polysaccharide/polyol phosphate export permease